MCLPPRTSEMQQVLQMHARGGYDEDEREALETDAQTAYETFSTFFTDRPGLKRHGTLDEDSMRVFVLTANTASDPMALDQTKKWATEQVTKVSGGMYTLTVTKMAYTPAGLTSETELLTGRCADKMSGRLSD